ncbi:MAG: sulfate adenylyltransferase subunit CysN [Oleiphilaceae bacterium]|nr:sulfate adenylyltransferase subunit CysN [Oleiphilaceae bacterium]
MSHQSELISEDINEYLKQHEQKELLRLLTCGSVDDGKSTLIGRLLHDSHMIYEDHLEAIKKDSVKSGTNEGEIDLALLVDGLQAEREQGITIDVAYRYFSTAKRKFIIADTPGHEQYTRNMATGASTADLAIILIDARHGVLTQTRRHSFIASLLGIKHVVVAINKMDLVDYSEERYNEIKADYLEFASDLQLKDIRFVPLSALKGTNVVSNSELTPWFTDAPLMDILENVQVAEDRNFQDFRLPVQYVNRPNLNFRGFCGTVASGEVNKGDELMALPSGKKSTVKSIVTYEGEHENAFAGQAITITLNDEIDVSRGDMLVKPSNLPSVGQSFTANIVWMNEAELQPGKLIDIKLGSTLSSGSVNNIIHTVDVNTLEKNDADNLALNSISLCELTLNQAVTFDPYDQNKATGAFIIIDRLTNVTIGAGMIVSKSDRSDTQEWTEVTAQERSKRFGHEGKIIACTGELAEQLVQATERKLFDQGLTSITLSASQFTSQESLNEAATAIKAASAIVIYAGEAQSNTDLTLSAETESQIVDAIKSI